MAAVTITVLRLCYVAALEKSGYMLETPWISPYCRTRGSDNRVSADNQQESSRLWREILRDYTPDV